MNMQQYSNDELKSFQLMERLAFLLHKVRSGDHKALENAEEAIREAVEYLDNHDRRDEWHLEYLDMV